MKTVEPSETEAIIPKTELQALHSFRKGASQIVGDLRVEKAHLKMRVDRYLKLHDVLHTHIGAKIILFHRF